MSDWIVKLIRHAPDFKYSQDKESITHVLSEEDIYGPEVHSDFKRRLSVQDSVPTAYVDGCCFGNGKENATAGIGVHWESTILKDHAEPIHIAPSNNRAELQAAISAIKEGINHGFRNMNLMSDSLYVITNVKNNIIMWESNGWKTNQGKQIVNMKEFKEIQELGKKININWVHVKGHSHDMGNDRAHELANQGALIGPSVGKNEAGDIGSMNHQSTEPRVNSQIKKNNEGQTLAIRTEPEARVIQIPLEIIKMEQSKDDEIIKARKELDSSVGASTTGDGISLYLDMDNVIRAKGKVKIAKGIEVLVDAIYIPKLLRNKIVMEVHNSKWISHANYINTCKNVLRRYFWADFRSDISKYLSNCDTCQKMSIPRKKVIVMDFPKPQNPGEVVAIDIVGPLMKSQGGDRYILSMIDLFSRYVILAPMKNQETETVADVIEKWYISLFGAPETLLSDRGSNFRSSLFKEICLTLRIKHIFSPPYHPSTNGMVERANREIKKKLAILCERSGDTWADKLHLIQFAHNGAHHSGINCSPNVLMFGRELDFPNKNNTRKDRVTTNHTMDYVNRLQNRLQVTREIAHEFESKTRRHRNKRINDKRILPSYQMDDLVLCRRIRKDKSRRSGFKLPYEGPFLIKNKVSDVCYDICKQREKNPKMIRVHAERLKRYQTPRALYTGDNTIPEGNIVRKQKRDEVLSYEELIRKQNLLKEIDYYNERTGLDQSDKGNKSTEGVCLEPMMIDELVLQRPHKSIEPVLTVEGKNTETPDEVVEISVDEANVVREQIAFTPNTLNHRYDTRSKGDIEDNIWNKFEIKRGKIIKKD